MKDKLLSAEKEALTDRDIGFSTPATFNVPLDSN